MIFRTSLTLAGTSFLKNIIRNGSGKSSTIFSLCSGHGKCGVSVFRISGPDALSAIKSMTKINTRSSTLTKKAVFYAKILHSRTQKQIDQGIVLWFPGPNSFTGEDVCELQTHGGPAIAKLILSSLSSLQKFRPALPGEFIRRSFENSKIDLTQVEGLHDLINAETSEQHSLALNMYNGQLKETYTNWSNTLLKNLAYLEALVDFGEEDNLDENIYNKAIQSVTCLHAEVANHLNDSRIYEQIRDGVKVCIIGKSNVGKSSLLNALCNEKYIFVSGTTRDIIEVTVNVDGYMLVVSDTAGMRETVDKVERLGIERAVDW
ncbi:hypothetical protein HELRODRAFT_70952 [Helobdella robusta]|uniref:TrmE-type G domain-containing protein n=1 Tax=Helobdella robusta TaxID=6412 RepID=T1G0E9_HELRO|nr:hypothetical protein HELRODRAFT_70952 [Helobdella robusta]ESN90286.1 hypothetical protein HELRODRAFT_70952 [Helobdella robusta]